MKVLFCVAAVVGLIATVEGHGYLLNPPARGTAWRMGFNTPTDSNDMGNYCGGRGTQHNKNGGKCGVCGEEFLNPNKRLEPGPANKFATGTIVGNYQQGQTIDVTIMITAFHKGYFEFRLCENNVPQKGKDSSIAVTYDCLNKNLLTSAVTGETRFPAVTGKSTHQVKLPADVTCSACVLQWRYRTGNNWGCEGGTCGSGMGPQEEFVGCSDIAIQSADGKLPPVPTKPTSTTTTTRRPTTTTTRRPTTTTTTRQPTTTTTARTRPTTTPTTRMPPTRQPITSKPIATEKPIIIADPVTAPVYTRAPAPVWPIRTHKVCRGTAFYGPRFDSYCNLNCNAFVPYCPPSHCVCN